jgi:hypothetical protein
MNVLASPGKTKRRALGKGKSMKQLSYFPILAMAVAGLAAPIQAQTAPSIDPDAMAALTRVGNYLRSLKAFQIRSTTTSETVLDDGQKVQVDSVADLLVDKPNKFRLEVTGDHQHRLFFYDGKKFTLFAQRMNYYATVAAPPTILELVDKLEENFDIELPMVDMFYWGTPRAAVSEIKSATNLGPSSVGGVTCQQFAFRQPGIDWQIWIQNGDYPLPRKLVISTLTDEARPEHMSVYNWNLAPSFDDAAFAFDAPKDAHPITFAAVKAARDTQK